MVCVACHVTCGAKPWSCATSQYQLHLYSASTILYYVVDASFHSAAIPHFRESLRVCLASHSRNQLWQSLSTVKTMLASTRLHKSVDAEYSNIRRRATTHDVAFHVTRGHAMSRGYRFPYRTIGPQLPVIHGFHTLPKFKLGVQ